MFSKRALVCATWLCGVPVLAQTRTAMDGANPLYVEAAFAAGSTHAGAGYLGISFRDVNDDEIPTLHLKDGHGVEIIMVDHDGPAGKAGLREHDVVLSVNGGPIDGEDQLRRLLHDMPPGRSVSLVVCHEGMERTVNATLANRAELEKRAWEQHWTVPQPQAEDAALVPQPDSSVAPHSGFGLGHGFMSGHLLPLTSVYTGATVDAMGAQLADFFGVKDGKGLLVHAIDANSPAAAAGLRAGDVVTRMNGAPVTSKNDWTRALHDGKGHPVSMVIMRDRQQQTLTMVADARKRSSMEAPVNPAASGWSTMSLR